MQAGAVPMEYEKKQVWLKKNCRGQNRVISKLTLTVC